MIMDNDSICTGVFCAFILVLVVGVLCAVFSEIYKIRGRGDVIVDEYRIVPITYRGHTYTVWHRGKALGVAHDPECRKCLEHVK